MAHRSPSRTSAFFRRPQFPLWLKLALCGVIGVGLAIASPLIIRDAYLAQLTGRIETIAYLISSDRVNSLRTNSDDSQSDYDVLKERLMRVKSANQDARFLYIMARDSARNVSFLVDSEVPGTDGFSPRGQAYPEASQGLIAMFDNGHSLIEGPVSDRWGSWFSALAPIRDSSGAVVGVVGLDIPSTSYIGLLTTAALIPLIGAGLVGAIIVISDRSAKKRYETTRMRGELVAIASQELKTPLKGIRWGEEQLRNGQLDTKATKIINDMYDSTIKLEESIDDVLQLASLQTIHQHNFRMVTTNMVEMIEDIMTANRLSAQEKGVTIQYGPNWPVLVMLNCDPLPMKRVFNNLINNAVKYTRPHTMITIDYEVIEGDHVFTITDQGIGIPKNEQSKVFTGFYRASNAVHEGISGSGMGLYLSQSVIEKHGGRLWLDSKEGSGTTIYVRLPAK